jgi:hypothetical protein
MNVQIKDGMLVITIPLQEAGPISASGKTRSRAYGQAKVADADGTMLVVQVNAYERVTS